MIIEIHKAAANVNGSVYYNSKKLAAGNSTIICYDNITVENEDILSSLKREFRKLDIANIRTKKVSFHASINPTAEELEKVDIKEIIFDYMKFMGYAKQPYMAVVHHDIDRTHFHIVSHRVKSDGTKINSSNEIYRSHAFEKQLNKKLHEQAEKSQGSRERPFENLPEDTFEKFDIKKSKHYRHIREIYNSACRYQYSNLFELQKILSDRGVELIEQDDHFIAAGMVDRERRTKAIAVDFSKIKPAKRKMIPYTQKQKIKNIMEFVLKVSHSENHARHILAKKGLGIHFLKKDEKIYGVYFIDHVGKIIIKASEVSKEISARKWEELNSGRWSDYKENLKSFKPDFSARVRQIPYNCLSMLHAGAFMYNPFENKMENYKDLKYLYSRLNNRRTI